MKNIKNYSEFITEKLRYNIKNDFDNNMAYKYDSYSNERDNIVKFLDMDLNSKIDFYKRNKNIFNSDFVSSLIMSVGRSERSNLVQLLIGILKDNLNSETIYDLLENSKHESLISNITEIIKNKDFLNIFDAFSILNFCPDGSKIYILDEIILKLNDTLLEAETEEFLNYFNEEDRDIVLNKLISNKLIK